MRASTSAARRNATGTAVEIRFDRGRRSRYTG